jgi:hypothetical protein
MSYDPFVIRSRSGYVSDPTQHTIATLLGRSKPLSGDVGLEVEVEGNMFPKTSEFDEDPDESSLIPSQWFYTHDGSLRGEDNAEYVLKSPLKFDEVPLALDDLWQMFDDYGSELDESNRTSVHVHLNAQSWHLNRLAAFAGLYFSVEEILTAWCGDARVGNLFCLRAKDAPAIIGKLRQFLNAGDFGVFDEGLHYAAFNAHSLTDKGSIEIRTMRGVREPETIKVWVSTLQHIYELSEQYPDPRGVCEGFSGYGYEHYLKSVIGPHWEQIVQQSGMSPDEIRTSMYAGIRIAQNICYCRDWSKFKAGDVKPDPFGRPIKQLQGYAPEPVYVEEASSVGPTSALAVVMQQTLLNNAPPTAWSNFYTLSTNTADLMPTEPVPPPHVTGYETWLDETYDNTI